MAHAGVDFVMTDFMNKQNIGMGLKTELRKDCDIVRISRWAFTIFSNEKSLEPDVKDILETLFSMEDDPQFELSQEELTKLADNLIAEGEKEDLGKPNLEIKEVAQVIGDDWVMCPICQESWENVSKYGMVRCPKCNSKLHNSKFNPAGFTD